MTLRLYKPDDDSVKLGKPHAKPKPTLQSQPFIFHLLQRYLRGRSLAKAEVKILRDFWAWSQEFLELHPPLAAEPIASEDGGIDVLIRLKDESSWLAVGAKALVSPPDTA